MSIEQALADLTAAVTANTTMLERVALGQQKALDIVETEQGEKRSTGTRTRKKSDDLIQQAAAAATAKSEPEGKVEEPAPASTESAAAVVTAVSEDDIRAVAKAYATGTVGTGDEKKAFMASVAAHFGAATLVGEKGIKGDANLQKTLFFINRKAAGKTVDFAFEYDFDGAADQDVAEPADDDFNIG
jgi:hypothetical protein